MFSLFDSIILHTKVNRNATLINAHGNFVLNFTKYENREEFTGIRDYIKSEFSISIKVII